MTLALKLKHAFLLLALCGILFRSTPILAGVIFESGTLGPTGVTSFDIAGGMVPGASIRDNIFQGVRFQLNQPVVTTQIGGHFVAAGSGTFFGVIIELDDENDFPNSDDISSSDVLGATLLTFPVPSDEVFGNLALSLGPGWYALVFGGGLFGTSGSGAMTLNNPDLSNPSYIGFQPLSPAGWTELFPVFQDFHFLVVGVVVPEPAVASLMFIAAFFCSLSNASRLR